MWTLILLQFTVDDAFISFRYAKILFTHGIWNWNPSGPRVESYTSALYTVLAVIPMLLHIPPALFFKAFGTACIAAMVYRVVTEASSRFAMVIGVMVIGLFPTLWLHAFSGLETPLYILLILEMALCVEHAADAQYPYVCLLFLLLPLTRPEGVVFSILGAILFVRRRRDADTFPRWLVVAAFVGLVYFIARWHYFGQLLPNPFYV